MSHIDFIIKFSKSLVKEFSLVGKKIRDFVILLKRKTLILNGNTSLYDTLSRYSSYIYIIQSKILIYIQEEILEKDIKIMNRESIIKEIKGKIAELCSPIIIYKSLEIVETWISPFLRNKPLSPRYKLLLKRKLKQLNKGYSILVRGKINGGS